MSVLPPWEDTISMAFCAAKKLLSAKELEQIDCVLFATETGLDHSKAASLPIHELLGLNPDCRCVEIKQACYAGTFSLQTAYALIASSVHQNVLILCSDVARYGLGSTGESSQGAGAVALLIKKNPALASLNPKAGFLSRHVHDFWRPLGHSEALVDGRYSCQVYLQMLDEVCEKFFIQNPNLQIETFCYHLPVPRLVEKAHMQSLVYMNNTSSELLNAQLSYGRQVGNCYTASLYLGFLSLLEQSEENLEGRHIALYSYGSGATCDLFSVCIEHGYRDVLDRQEHERVIQRREDVGLEFYEWAYENYLKGWQWAQKHESFIKTKIDPPCLFMGLKDSQRSYQLLCEPLHENAQQTTVYESVNV